MFYAEQSFLHTYPTGLFEYVQDIKNISHTYYIGVYCTSLSHKIIPVNNFLIKENMFIASQSFSYI